MWLVIIIPQEQSVVEVPFKTREYRTCTSDYRQIAFLNFEFYENARRNVERNAAETFVIEKV